MRIGNTLRFLAPFARPGSTNEHEQNWAKLDERFNSLPVNTPMVAMSGTDSISLASATQTRLPLPPTVHEMIGFTLDGDTLICNESGWYVFAWETVLTANSSAGYRQVTLKVDNPYHSDYANLTPSLEMMDGVAIAVLAGSVLVPLLVGSVVSIDGYTGSAAAQTFSIPRLGAHWVRPIDM